MIHAFRLWKRDDYFRVNFDLFILSVIFYRSLRLIQHQQIILPKSVKHSVAWEIERINFGQLWMKKGKCNESNCDEDEEIYYHLLSSIVNVCFIPGGCFIWPCSSLGRKNYFVFSSLSRPLVLNRGAAEP